MSYKSQAFKIIVASKGNSVGITIARDAEQDWIKIERFYHDNIQLNLARFTKLCKIGVLALESMEITPDGVFNVTFDVTDNEASFPILWLRKSYLDSLGFNVGDLTVDELEVLADLVQYYLDDGTEIDDLTDDIIRNEEWWWGDDNLLNRIRGE